MTAVALPGGPTPMILPRMSARLEIPAPARTVSEMGATGAPQCLAADPLESHQDRAARWNPVYAISANVSPRSASPC